MLISRKGSGTGVIRETQGRVQIKLNDLLKNNVNGLVQQPRRKPAVQNQSGGL